jgi:DNA-binding CsgD family transcriptional regulator
LEKPSRPDKPCQKGESFKLDPPIPSQHDVEAYDNRIGITALEKWTVSRFVAGRTRKESAELIGVSQRSLRHHMASIMAKLGVVNRLELVLVALDNNLIDSAQ